MDRATLRTRDQPHRSALIAVPRRRIRGKRGPRNRHRDNKIDSENDRCLRVNFGRHVNDLVAARLARH